MLKSRIKEKEINFPDWLFLTPNAIRAPEFDKGGSTAYFIDSVNDTKFFAYVGIPKKDSQGREVSENNKVPAVVLVHGATGIAFYEWVDFWTARGYAAIAVSTDGNIPIMSGENETSICKDKYLMPGKYTVNGETFKLGPPNLGYEEYLKPINEQWSYNAISDVIAGHSFIRSFKQVDCDRVAITGISYGGILTCQTVARDARFVCAVPIYGSYKLRYGNTHFSDIFQQNARKRELWDNDVIMEGIKTPFMFINGNTDHAFSVLSTSESYLAIENSNLLLRDGLLHSHVIGAFEIPEAWEYVDSYCLNAPKISAVCASVNKRELTAEFKGESGRKLDKIIGYYTDCEIVNQDTKWRVFAIKNGENTCKLTLPENAKYAYVSALDDRGIECSSNVIKT